MASVGKDDSRLDFPLPAELKETIELAADRLGQSVSEFAISALARAAEEVIQGRDVTWVSAGDYERLNALFNDENRQPNQALLDAARRYRQNRG